MHVTYAIKQECIGFYYDLIFKLNKDELSHILNDLTGSQGTLRELLAIMC